MIPVSDELQTDLLYFENLRVQHNILVEQIKSLQARKADLLQEWIDVSDRIQAQGWGSCFRCGDVGVSVKGSATNRLCEKHGQEAGYQVACQGGVWSWIDLPIESDT